MPQDDKIFLNLAGEFAVASELNRRRVLSSVTYGASKSADIFALNRDMSRIVRVEVKATQHQKWPIGDKATKLTPSSADVFWVLVMLPGPVDGSPTNAQRIAHSLRFFVLSAEELHTAWKKPTEAYNERYLARHGTPYAKRAVPNVCLQDVEQYEGQWGKIVSLLEMSDRESS